MPLENKDFDEITNRLDDRYVKISDCEHNQNKVYDRVGKMEVSLAKIDTKFGILVGVLSAIAVPILGICIKFLFGS